MHNNNCMVARTLSMLADWFHVAVNLQPRAGRITSQRNCADDTICTQSLSRIIYNLVTKHCLYTCIYKCQSPSPEQASCTALDPNRIERRLNSISLYACTQSVSHWLHYNELSYHMTRTFGNLGGKHYFLVDLLWAQWLMNFTYLRINCACHGRGLLIIE